MAELNYHDVDIRIRDVGLATGVLVSTVLAVVLESMWNAGWRVTLSTLIVGLGVLLILAIWACLVRPHPSARIELPWVPGQRGDTDDAGFTAPRPTGGDFPGVRSPGSDFFRPPATPPGVAEFATADLFAPNPISSTSSASAAAITAVLPPVVHAQGESAPADDDAPPKANVRLVEPSDSDAGN